LIKNFGGGSAPTFPFASRCGHENVNATFRLFQVDVLSDAKLGFKRPIIIAGGRFNAKAGLICHLMISSI
jgi:hypothetical protein